MASQDAKKWIVVCDKCGQKYPIGTEYCKKPTCKADLSLYGHPVLESEPLDVEAACEQMKQMLSEVLNLLRGKNFEEGYRTKYQNEFDKIHMEATKAASEASLQKCLEDAKKWKERCLHEIDMATKKENAYRQMNQMMSEVMYALQGKGFEKEYRTKYQTEFDKICNDASKAASETSLQKCVEDAKEWKERCLHEIDMAAGKETIYKQMKQMRSDVMSALRGKCVEEEYRSKYQKEFDKIYMEATKAASDVSLQKSLEDAKKWKERCLHEIDMAAGKETVYKQMEQMQSDVMSALQGKSFEKEYRTKYQKEIDKIYMEATKVTSDASLQKSLEDAKKWKKNCLYQINLAQKREREEEGKFARKKEAACKQIKQMQSDVMNALRGESFEEDCRTKYESEFEKIYKEASKAANDDSLQKCVNSAEQWKKSCLSEIDLTKKRGKGSWKERRAIKKARKGAEKQIDTDKKTVMRSLSRKKERKLYRSRFESEFINIRIALSSCTTVNEINACVEKAKSLRDEKMKLIHEMKDKIPAWKIVLFVILILFVILLLVIAANAAEPEAALDVTGNTVQMVLEESATLEENDMTADGTDAANGINDGEEADG